MTNSDAKANSGPEYLPLLGTVIAVEDIEKATHFYQHLGFECEMTINDTDGKVIHATLRFGANVFMLGRTDKTHYVNESRAHRIAEGPRGLGVTLLLVVRDLKTIYDFVCSSELPILQEPVEEYYGDTIFMFIDPFGYEWKIAQTNKSLTPQEVINASGLSGFAK